MLDDYHHLSKSHDHELETIDEFAKSSGMFQPCDTEKCNYSDRRFKTTPSDYIHKNDADKELHFCVSPSGFLPNLLGNLLNPYCW